ncbi:putative disease resistance RPP13-like protein 1 [Typha angustifolia]|uniref:putative disease resistance RPP13-like protein 1 n=1 Tax=Typha angustifolia TaxID=59011 RepID=UPI003C2BC797
MDSVKRVGSSSPEVGVFPSLQVLHIEVMPALEEFAGGAGTTQWLPCLERLQISYCPRPRVFSNLPCGLKDVHIDSVGWAALPELLWQGDNNSLRMSSTSSLSSLKIMRCEELVSLAEGLLLHPQLFPSLKKLSISYCEKLTHLPIGGFERFTSLKDLRLMGCPKLWRGSTAGKFLPPSLQFLSVYNCDVLDPLPNAPEDLNFLHNVVLRCCAIKSLPSEEVLAGWKSVKGLSINDCSEIESLGGLQALSSLKSLAISGCSKLVSEGQMELASTSFSSSSSSSSSSLILDFLHIDDPALLRTMPLKSISAREVQVDFCDEARSSSLEEWVWRNHTSLQKLIIMKLSSPQFPLSVHLQSLSSLEFLHITWCNNLRSLPELPSSLKSFWVAICPLELEESCLRESGLEWPKIQHIPKVKIGCYSKEDLASISPAEHRSRRRELEIQKRKRS